MKKEEAQCNLELTHQNHSGHFKGTIWPKLHGNLSVQRWHGCGWSFFTSYFYMSHPSLHLPTDHELFSWLHLNLGGNVCVRNFWGNLRIFCRQSSRCQSCFVPQKSHRWRRRASHYRWRPSHQTQGKHLSKHWWATLETYFTVTLSLCIFWFV